MSNLIPGRKIFELETAHGLPFQVTLDLCRERNLQFNAVAYCRAALESKWSTDKLRGRFGERADLYIAMAFGTVIPPMTDEEKRSWWEAADISKSFWWQAQSTRLDKSEPSEE